MCVILNYKLYSEVKKSILELYNKANIILTEEEKNKLEIVDFGLNDIYNEGLQLIIYVNNERYCAKEMVLLPKQACPEHKHPTRKNGDTGKQETFRCKYGMVYLYTEEENGKGDIQKPERNSKYYTAEKRIVLFPGDQYTIPANTKHWFRAGEEGAVITEFSSNSEDSSDVFTNPNIIR